jgi:hypothetical protein
MNKKNLMGLSIKDIYGGCERKAVTQAFGLASKQPG